MGAPPAGKSGGCRRRGLHPLTEGGYVRRRGVRVHAQRRRDQPAGRGHAHRLRIHHTLRHRQPHGGRQGQRADRTVRLPPPQRRRGGGDDQQIRPRSQP